MTITEFLEARWREIEDTARAAAPTWDWSDDPELEWMRHEWEDLPDDHFSHARSNHPAYVLADIAAKRAILAQRAAIGDQLADADIHAQHNIPTIVNAGIELDNVLKHLAVPFDQHPDYDETWRP